MLTTIFLDAGGVLLFPNWHRISGTLARHGVDIPASALAEAEPRARRILDDSRTIGTTSDASRGWLFFDLILEQAGTPPSASAQWAGSAFTVISRGGSSRWLAAIAAAVSAP